MSLHNPDKWDRLASAWEDAGPPATPSPDDIAHFSELLDEAGAIDSALILGSTPSLRKMVSQRFPNCRIVCADFSRRMYEVTSEVIGGAPPNEEFVCSDWIYLALSRRFSVILGDKAIDNVHPDNWGKFFSRLHNHLVPSGYFLVHMALADPSFKGVTVTSALAKWADKLVAGRITPSDAASGLWEDLLTGSAFYGGHYYNTARVDRFGEEIEAVGQRLSSREAVSDSWVEIFKLFVRNFGTSFSSEWSSYELDEIISAMTPWFTIAEIRYSNDYEVAGFQPIASFIRKP